MRRNRPTNNISGIIHIIAASAIMGFGNAVGVDTRSFSEGGTAYRQTFGTRGKKPRIKKPRGTTGGPTRAEVPARPCLHCGRKTKHPQPFCSAEHIKLWRAENPGNGRYAHPDWKDDPILYRVRSRPIRGDANLVILPVYAPDSPLGRTYKLGVGLKSECPTTATMLANQKPIDCMIDAMRAGDRYLRERAA
jgi:hypothetical protein